MASHGIEISGITPAAQFPVCPPHYPCRQICETDKLCIAAHKPEIENILQLCVNVSICSFKIICTPLGRKLIIEARKHIKIVYVAAEPCQSVHTAHFMIPFCTFLLLREECKEVVDICIVIEDIMIHPIDCRCFSLSMVMFTCPIVKEKPEKCDCDQDDDFNCSHPDMLITKGGNPIHKKLICSCSEPGMYVSGKNYYQGK